MHVLALANEKRFTKVNQDRQSSSVFDVWLGPLTTGFGFGLERRKLSYSLSFGLPPFESPFLPFSPLPPFSAPLLPLEPFP